MARTHTTRNLIRLGLCLPRRAFTLMELLIAMAAIAVLACILLQTKALDRHLARQAVCQDHLRQWGRAYQIYAIDYRDAIPYQYSSTGFIDPWGSRIIFYYYQTVYINRKPAWTRYLYPDALVPPVPIVAGGTPLDLCPSDPRPYQWPVGNNVTSYGLNWVGAKASNSWYPYRQKRPGETFIMADSYASTNGRSITVIYDGDMNSGNGFYGAFANRHSNGSNLLFFDWHTELRKYPFPLVASQDILWYGAY